VAGRLERGNRFIVNAQIVAPGSIVTAQPAGKIVTKPVEIWQVARVAGREMTWVTDRASRSWRFKNRARRKAHSPPNNY
jgi:hypothetical protein